LDKFVSYVVEQKAKRDRGEKVDSDVNESELFKWREDLAVKQNERMNMLNDILSEVHRRHDHVIGD
jgi:predicted transcriptional regulator